MRYGGQWLTRRLGNDSCGNPKNVAPRWCRFDGEELGRLGGRDRTTASGKKRRGGHADRQLHALFGISPLIVPAIYRWRCRLVQNHPAPLTEMTPELLLFQSLAFRLKEKLLMLRFLRRDG